MNRMRKLAARLAREEAGGEIIEYALILGLIVVATIAIIAAVGGKVVARWNTITSSSL